MAKKKAPGKKKLLPYREVTVKSRAYGEHMRAARGSKTPVALNKVMQEQVKKTAVINKAAKRVHDLLKQCRQPFKEKMLWQVMLGRMRKAETPDLLPLLTTLTGMELNSQYPLSRFAYPTLSPAEWNGTDCVLTLYGSQPHIKNGDTQYGYEMFLLTLGKNAEEDSVASMESEWMAADEKAADLQFAFAVSPKADYYVVCLHFMTGKKGKETGTLASRGMAILSVEKATSVINE